MYSPNSAPTNADAADILRPDPSTIPRPRLYAEGPKGAFECQYPGCEFWGERKCDLAQHVRRWHNKDALARMLAKQGEVLDYLEQFYLLDRAVMIQPISVFSDQPAFRQPTASLNFPEHNLTVFIEVDCHQGVGRLSTVGDEVQRMKDLGAATHVQGTTGPIVWLRFNPDSYHRNGITQSTSKKERLAKLHAVLQCLCAKGSLHADNDWGVSYIYLFFDMRCEQLVVLQNPDFPEDAKDNVALSVQ